MAVTLTEKAATHVQNFLAKRGSGVALRLGVGPALDESRLASALWWV